MPTDIDRLLELSRCMDCLTPGQMSYIETSLLDTWAFNEAEFTPDSIPEYVGASVRWYEASDFTGLADGETIAVSNPWVDRSPSQSNATSTIAMEPTYRTNIFGDRPAVRFLGINGMTFNSGVIALTDFTFLAVVRVYADSIWMSRIAINRQVRAFQQNANILSLAFPGVVLSDELNTPFSDAKLIGYRRVASTGIIDFFENGVVIGADTTNTATLHLEQIGVTNGGPDNIDIGEMVIYNSVVSTEDIQALYNDYFKPKYGLP